MKTIKVDPIDLTLLEDDATLGFIGVDYVVGPKGTHVTIVEAVADAIKAGGSKTIAIPSN